MTKRVREAETLGLKINETDLTILREISRRSRGTKRAVPITVRELREITNRCEVSVRLSVKTLDDNNLIGVRHRHLSNGGQIENAYQLTELGQKVIKLSGGVPKKGAPSRRPLEEKK